jgi:N-acetyl-gamma-glutamyl-phosphate reductase
MASRRTVAVAGATGYGGSEVVRLLLRHPGFELTAVTSERLAGEPLARACPWLATGLVLGAFDPKTIDAEFVVLAQDAGFALRNVPRLPAGVRVVDLSAAYRLRDARTFQDWYGEAHSDPEGLAGAVYGLPELAPPDAIREARIVANPGCYPTSALLALAPLAAAGMVDGTPIVDAKSGVSGAGRSKTDPDYAFSELTAGFRAYGVTGHRHTPEIEQGLGGRPVRFVPHLIPAARGIHATIHFPARAQLPDILDTWRGAYAGRAFVALAQGWPSMKAVTGSNRCLLAAGVDARTGMATLAAVIDNLLKGAAGQAVQNLNIMCGLPEDTGLPLDGVWP